MRPSDDLSASARAIGGRWLWAIFLLALAARAAWGAARMIASHDADLLSLPDEQQYWIMAKSLAAGGGLRDELGFCAGRMPLYPAFLSLFAALPHGAAWARGVQWIIGALAAVFAARIGGAAFSRGVGILAGLLVALDPYLIYASSLLLTETPFITALIGLWGAALAWAQTAEDEPSRRARRDRTWAQASMCLFAVVCIYLREAALAFALALTVTLGLRGLGRGTKPEIGLRSTARAPRGWAAGAWVTGVMLLSLAPWALRNQAAIGRWVWLTTRGGITLYDGVRAGADGSSDLGDIKAGPDVRGFVERGDEAAWDDHFRQAALGCIRSDPWRMLRLAPVKLARTWSLVPNLAEGRSLLFIASSAAWTGGVYAFALIGVYHGWWRRRAAEIGKTPLEPRQHEVDTRWLVITLAAPALMVALLHSVYVGSVRYRLPAMPFLEILAAVGAWRVIRVPGGAGKPEAERLVAASE